MLLVELSTSLADLVAKYIKTVDVDAAFGTGTLDEICTDPGNCAMVSEDLAKWLKANGVSAKVITGFDMINPEWAKRAKVRFRSEEDAHTVVAVGNQVIDLTARQFEPTAKFPRIIPLSQFKKEWTSVDVGTSRPFVESVQSVTFYKAVPISSLKKGLIPGTVTTSYDEALQWYERYNSTKKNPKGPARHIDRQPACIIKFKYDVEKLLSSDEFQRAGVKEHDRRSSWTSLAREKAQINDPISDYEVVLEAPKPSW